MEEQLEINAHKGASGGHLKRWKTKLEGLRMHFADLHLTYVATLGPAVGHAVHFV